MYIYIYIDIDIYIYIYIYIYEPAHWRGVVGRVTLALLQFIPNPKFYPELTLPYTLHSINSTLNPKRQALNPKLYPKP